MNGRRIYHARGKVLGGSSSINGMIFQRGNPLDYRALGRRPRHGGMGLRPLPALLQENGDLPRRWRRVPRDGGPLVLERGPATGPLFGAFFAAVQQAGLSLTDDVNGYRQEGFAAFDRNIERGRRLSAARAYLHPVMDRPNLTVRTRAFVTKILVEHGRAVGVEYVSRGRREQAGAGEVICCGGSINSPQLLQLSGIGDADELQVLGIPPVADLPGVGENLQDHLEVYIQYACTKPVSLAPALQWRRRPLVALEWALWRRGPGAIQPLRGRWLCQEQR